ncbi:polysaccharide biosynthesis/export family protein [Sunxiuqinia sp. A32]|uniref:polysaccharide biosynthesis/export family protein n=1 Tax=Sunxiuqinia sp. A32 TaxID=3461496 RepID=UPI00404611F4
MSIRKHFIHYILVMMVGISFFSCSSEKKLTFLYDVNTEAFLNGVPEPPSTYIIQSNDNLYINISTINAEVNALFSPGAGNSGYNRPYESLSGQYISGFLVDDIGEVEIPILGKIKVGGLSLKEAKESIQIRADEYLNDATVQVKYLSFKVTVMGEVRQPGVVYNYHNRLTIFEAIGMAGGISEFASLDKTTVIREYEDGTQPFKVDLTSKNIFESEVFYLQPNDVVYIQPQKLKNARQNAAMYTLFMSTISTLLVIWRFIDTQKSSN